jgi:DNA-binding CsgD family transcriptional regulator
MLLERERELTVIGDALAEAHEGRGQVVLVEAAAGLGKTSLLRAACEAATAMGFACLRARASELERDFAYGCVRQLLEAVVANAAVPERDRLFDGAATLSEPLFSPAATPPSSSADTSFSVLHGLYWLLNNLAAEGGLALSLDDLHWADPASLRFTSYLAPRLDGLRVVVFASVRPGEGDTLELARLAAAPETAVIRPGPLSREATAALCERTLGVTVAPEFAAACREATGGNPFFLEALVREASEEGLATDAQGAGRVRDIGPAAVAQAVLLRLSGAPGTATRLVRVVAILGDGRSIAEAARVAELSEGEARAAADLLVKLGLLRPAGGLEFAHPIVREAVYGDVGPRQAAAAHARAAEILTLSGASEERIAAQIAKAEPTGDASRVELLRRVAAGALVRGAPVAAVAALRRALAEPPASELRGQVLLELGTAELRLGGPEAIEHLAAAVKLISEPALLTAAVRSLANALTFSGQSDRAVAAIESAIEVVGAGDRELALLLEADLAAHAQQARLDSRAPAAKRLERRGDLEGVTPGERLVVASLAFERARASESAAEAASYLEAGLAGGRLLGEQQLDVAGPFYHLVIGLLATDALDVLDECLEQALADARARASIPAVAYATAYLGRVALRRGAVGQAQADLQAALDLLTGHGIPFGIESVHGLLVRALLGQGYVEAAQQTLRSGGLESEIPPGLTSNLILEARGMLRLAQGRTGEGLADLVEFGHREELWGGTNPLASRWRSRASLGHAALGDREQARRMASEDLERARRWGAASGIGVALRALALVGGESPNVERLREASSVLGRSPARLERAHALTDLGGALRRANRRAEAQAALQDALSLAESCGARALVERARIELRAAGGRSSYREGDGARQLTVSERRVAELAAEGLSNPEIAQSLFVTRKTVETHLGNVYRKLDIPGRGALGRALAEADSQADD